MPSRRRRIAQRLRLLSVVGPFALCGAFAPTTASAAVWTSNLTDAHALMPAPAGDPTAILNAKVVFDDTAGTISAVVRMRGPLAQLARQSYGGDSFQLELANNSECRTGAIFGGGPGDVTLDYFFGWPYAQATVNKSSNTSRADRPQAIVTRDTVTLLLNDSWLIHDGLRCATGYSNYSKTNGRQTTNDMQLLGDFRFTETAHAGPAPLPAMTTADAVSLATHAIRHRARHAKNIQIRCVRKTVTRATCRASFDTNSKTSRATVAVWFARAAHSISAKSSVSTLKS